MSRQLSKTNVESTRQSTLVLAKSIQKPIVSSVLQESQQKSTGYEQTSSLRNNVRTEASFFDNVGKKDCYKKSSQNASKAVEIVQIVSNEEDKETTRHLKASTYLNISDGLVDGFNKPKSQMSESLKNMKSMSVGEQSCRKQLMQRHLSMIEAMELLDLNVDSEIVKQAMDQLFQQNIVQPPNEIEVWNTVCFARINENAQLPIYSSDGAAGMDLYSCESATIPANGKGLVSTGLKMSIPSGYYARVAPRSGLAVKNFIDVGAGVIDEDYRGEVKVLLFNFGETEFQVKTGERIAQLLIEPVLRADVVEVSVEKLTKTNRGDGGFGSTGV